MLRIFLPALTLALAFALPTAGAGEVRVFVGTYTGKMSKGIYVLKLDEVTGALSEPQLAAEVVSPSYLTISPDKKFVYAVNEVSNFGGKKSGGVSALSVDPATGMLTLLNQQPSGGDGPCYIAVDKVGRNALVANYGSGSVAALPIGADGRLAAPSSVVQHEGKGPDPSRQEGPHAHSIYLDAANQFAFACDLGLDKIMVTAFDPATGMLKPIAADDVAVTPKSGPRHLAFHPNGRFAYCNAEMGNIVTVFAFDAAKPSFNEIQKLSTIPDDFKGSTSTAEVVVHPSGKYVYVSNRGHDSVAAYAVDEQTGKLTSIGFTLTGGKTPRDINIDPSGKWLLAANQDSNSVTVLKIDAASGKLTAVGAPAKVGAPVCVKFMQQ